MGKTKKKTRRSAHPPEKTLDPSAPSPSEVATEATAEVAPEPRAATELQGRLEATLGRANLWLRDEIRAAFNQRRSSTVVTDNDFFEAEVLANYKRGPESVQDPDAFYPVTGVHYRPGWMYTPK